MGPEKNIEELRWYNVIMDKVVTDFSAKPQFARPYNWEQLNSKIKTNRTTKKYFGKYLYKLSMFAPGGKLTDHAGSIKVALGNRIYEAANASWSNRRSRELDKADASFLEVLRDLRLDTELGIKIIIVEPKVNFYAKTEEELLKIVTSTFKKSHYRYLTEITRPESEEAKTILDTGAIIRRSDMGYTHKVVLRDGVYTQEVKTNLLNYLDILGPDLIKMPGNLKRQLTKISTRSTGYMWGIYFHTNDPNIATFINIIHPALVSKCHEVVVIKTK